MRFATLAFCLLLARASHAELTIFDVQRTLPLSDGEKVYHDYYVDGGTEAGLKTGMTLTVRRKISLFDYYRNREVSDLQLKIAKVKVIQVQDNLSVVRLKEEISAEDAPISDDRFIMIGDHVDADAVAVVAEAPTPTPSPAAEPVPVPQIVINSVDLTVDQPPAPAPAAPSAPPPAAK